MKADTVLAAHIARRQADVARLGAWNALLEWERRGEQADTVRRLLETEPPEWARLWPAPVARA